MNNEERYQQYLDDFDPPPIHGCCVMGEEDWLTPMDYDTWLETEGKGLPSLMIRIYDAMFCLRLWLKLRTGTASNWDKQCAKRMGVK